MKHITVLGVKAVTRSKFIEQLEARLIEQYGRDEIKVVRYLCGNDYWDRWRKASNLITWGIKWTNERYRKETGMYPQEKNTLYVENGLLDQGRGLYVDDRGYFGGSSMVELGNNSEDYAPEWRDAVAQFVKRSWKWEYGEDGGDPDGPIILAVQTNNDAPMQHFFPGGNNAQPGQDNRKLAFLELCKSYLPKDREVIVRPHPKERRLPSKFKMPDNWRVDDHKERIYPMLRRASAVVGVNSTVLTEAMGLNIPIASLGYGSWKGTNCTLDCAADPSQLRYILDVGHDREARTRYLCRLLKHHQVPHSGGNIAKFIERSEPLARWIASLHDVDEEPNYRKQFKEDRREVTERKKEVAPDVTPVPKKRRRRRRAKRGRNVARLKVCLHCGMDTPDTGCGSCKCKHCGKKDC